MLKIRKQYIFASQTKPICIRLGPHNTVTLLGRTVSHCEDTHYSLYGTLSADDGVIRKVGEDTADKKLQGRRVHQLAEESITHLWYLLQFYTLLFELHVAPRMYHLPPCMVWCAVPRMYHLPPCMMWCAVPRMYHLPPCMVRSTTYVPPTSMVWCLVQRMYHLPPWCGA